MESKGVARPDVNILPSLPLPFYVRSTGHFLLEEGWSEDVPGSEKNFVQFYWCIEGEGEFLVGGKPCILRKNEVLYYLPLEDHINSVKSPGMEYRWVAFDGPMAEQIMLSYEYPRDNFYAGPCPHELFIGIFNSLREMSPFSQRKALALAMEILALAGGRQDDTSKAGQIVTGFMHIVQNNISDSSVNINTIADSLGVHRSTLNRIFHEKMHISPKEYLHQYRLQQALSLLRNTTFPISKIGLMVGVPYKSYFCHFIRQATGLNPTEYREQKFFSA